MQTLNEYIFSKATNKRPTPSSSPQTITEFLFDKVKEKTSSGQSFEEQLDKIFNSLGRKTTAIKKEQYQQINIATNLLQKQQETEKLIADILNLVQERSSLEKQYYTKVVEQRSPVEQIIQQPEIEQEEPQQEETPPEKLSAGGTTQVTQPTEDSKDLTEKDKQIKFADTMQLQPKASGIVAVSVLGEFLSSIGPLAGFLKPYVKNIATPFAVSMGVGQSIINTLLGGPVQAGELKTKEYQKEFGKTWSKFLGDENFISLFIDRTIDNLTGEPVGGFVPANWKDDPEFTVELNRVAQKFNINANDLLAVMLVETGGTLNPAIRNRKSGATGLIQFMPSTARGLGTTTDDLAKMTRAQQMKYVEKYFDNKLPQGATGGQIYAAVFLPAFIKEDVLTVRGEAYYNANVGLDYNNDGKISRSDLDAHVNAKKKQYKLESGDAIGDNRSPLMPYLLSGPEAGYDVSIQGYKVTMHGAEIVEPFENGFRVFPVKNRRYDVTENPEEVIDRWKQIAGGESIKIAGTAQGGGSKRSSRKVSSLAKDYKYWELFYSRQAAYSQIGTSRQGTSGTGYAPSIVSRWLASEQRTRTASRSYSPSVKPVKTETDVLMDQYKALIADGKHSEAKDLGMKIWNKTWRKTSKGLERIPSKPAPKATAAQMVSASSSSEKSPKIIINNLPSTNQSPSVQVVPPSSKPMIVPIPVVNYQRLRTELNMKRTK